MNLVEMGIRDVNTAMFQNWWEYGFLCQRQWTLLMDLRNVNLFGLSLCYLNLRLYLLWPPPCAVVSVMELQAPLVDQPFVLLQHGMDHEGQ